MELTLKQLKRLLKTLEEGGATEFEYQDDKYRVRLALGRGVPSALRAGTALPSEAPTDDNLGPGAGESDPKLVYVTSPFVGTFYRSANPDAEPFVEVGATVSKGQALCIVEAMKLMNEIESEFDGTVLERLVENGESVEFGQKLFRMRKS